MNAMTNNTQAPTITDKLILVRFKVHYWSGTKFDRNASAQVAENNDASSDHSEVGRYNKKLVDRASLLPVMQARTELLNRHYHMTAPWTDDGVRVLTSEMFFKYTQEMREATAAFAAAAKHFVEVEYPAQREKAKKRLGKLFNDKDYPSAADIAYAHRVPDVHFQPLPNPDDVRVWGVGEVAAREIEADVRSSVQRGIDDAHAHVAGQLIERAHEFVEKVQRFDTYVHRREVDPEAEPIDGETKGLRETAVENLREMVRVVLDGLNVKQDPKLADMARQLDVALKNVTVDKLREGEGLRTKKIEEVERIAGKFAGMFKPAKVAGGAR